MTNKYPWFFGAVVYEIYPRSFYDTDGDGVGDLEGIIEKLDYLNGKPNSLGVNAIWLSPFYRSPMVDFGYDISNYTNVDPLFGDLKVFKLLTKEAHKRNIKVMIDFVPNHTSDKHPWFLESKSSKQNPKRDWYVWQDAKSGNSPPNNWLSVFGGSAWEYSIKTNQYYLHSFLKQQPDLNWDNPEVRHAIQNAMKFWLELGVDGFRIDSAYYLSKDPTYQNDPINHEYDPVSGDPYTALKHINSKHGPNLTKYLRELTSLVKSYKDRFMILEAHPEKTFDVSAYVQLYNDIDATVCAPFNFEEISLPWDASAYKTCIDQFQARLKSIDLPVYNFGNHDRSRLVTRIGKQAARTTAMLQITLPGMPVMYYGDELGMRDVKIPRSLVKDPFEKNVPDRKLGRDPERTPMQWSSSINAGFSTTTPWLPVSGDFHIQNVNKQLKDHKSFLNLYRSLL
ncbi:MAG TPA: alpha-amylase family glycosyl hydrolase, partial [Candidatus Saccharimonadia bacterium]|nr:alpha-amylase family glycosyl hydrolase [Candidatus Saccharimonadia bacterium]